jgi:hypothetical protein
MLGKEARRRNRQSDLRQFLNRFCPGLDKTRQKFFRQSLWGILLAGSLVVARWLRWIPDRCKHPFYLQKRLLNQLKSQDWDHQQVLEQYQKAWGQHVQPDTPLIVDLCDLARPRARRMKYLALVRDGSDEGRLVNGYWCLEVYAYWGRGCLSPMLLHPYSSEDPAVLSENAEILKRVDQVLHASQGRGVLVMDIGADRQSLLIPWIDQHRRFVIRLRGDRHLLLDNGALVPAEHLAEQLLQHRPHGTRAWHCVYLPQRPRVPLYLVCRRLPGHDRPLILLSSLTVADLTSARNVLGYYRRRWRCEEAARFLKSQLGLERFALRTYEAFAPLMLLACLAMSFLTWMQLHYVSLARWLARARPGQHAAKFIYYRLRRWLEHQLGPAPPRQTST